jgi:hypothetical protein
MTGLQLERRMRIRGNKEVEILLISYSRGRMGLLKRLVKKAFMTFLCCCLHFHLLTNDRKKFHIIYEGRCDIGS